MNQEQEKIFNRLKYPKMNKKSTMALAAFTVIMLSFSLLLVQNTADLFGKIVVVGFILSLFYKLLKEIKKVPVLQGERTIFAISEDEDGTHYVQSYEEGPRAKIPSFIELTQGNDDNFSPYGSFGDSFLLVISGGEYYAIPGGLIKDEEE